MKEKQLDQRTGGGFLALVAVININMNGGCVGEISAQV